MRSGTSSWAGWIAGGAVFLALRLVEAAAPAAPQALGAAAAHGAALLLGVPLLPGPEPVLAHPDYPVQVVASCSGWNFLSLLAAALVARAWAARRIGPAALALPAAAAIAVLVNAGRLAAVSLAGRFLLPHLPPVAAVSFHTALGVAVFLPALILACLLWERRIIHERCAAR